MLSTAAEIDKWGAVAEASRIRAVTKPAVSATCARS